jgi:hypothetical protein
LAVSDLTSCRNWKGLNLAMAVVYPRVCVASGCSPSFRRAAGRDTCTFGNDSAITGLAEKVKRGAVWKPRVIREDWQELWGSNSRPSVLETDALTS